MKRRRISEYWSAYMKLSIATGRKPIFLFLPHSSIVGTNFTNYKVTKFHFSDFILHQKKYFQFIKLIQIQCLPPTHFNPEHKLKNSEKSTYTMHTLCTFVVVEKSSARNLTWNKRIAPNSATNSGTHSCVFKNRSVFDEDK